MPPDSIHNTIERKARRAIFEHALFRIENAVILAGSILLAYFLPNPLPGLLPWWNWWTWILLGLVAVSAIVVSAFIRPSKIASRRIVGSARIQTHSSAVSVSG